LAKIRSSILRLVELRKELAVRQLYRLILVCLGYSSIFVGAHAQREVTGTGASTPIPSVTQALELRQEATSEAVSTEGLVRLDVTVTDEAGKAVTGLQRTDFEVFDNDRENQIIAFRALSRDSPRVILLIDTLGVPRDQAAFEREQASRFLRQNAGHLNNPVMIYSLDESGFSLTADASIDGNALADAVSSDSRINAFFTAPLKNSQPKIVPVDASLLNFPALAALRALGTAAVKQDHEPGRKLLIWIGPGPSERATDGYAPYAKGVINYSPLGEHRDARMRELFQKLVWFTTLLRQARVTLDCILVGEQHPINDKWLQSLEDVPPVGQANWANLYRGALAIRTGGQVVAASKDLSSQIANFVEGGQISYSLTFDPTPAVEPDEYHRLKVDMHRPGFTVHTSTGYYNQPFYSDPPDQQITKLTTVAQLEEGALHGTRGGVTGGHLLSSLALAERLPREKIQVLSRKLRVNGAAMEMIAAQSAFLPPPTSETLVDPPPDPIEEQRTLAAATNYLSQVIPKLPDFFATRTATYYGEVVPYPGLDSKVQPQPLHLQNEKKDTVLYRRGEEIVEPQRSVQASMGGSRLNSYGTFGPILFLLQRVLNSSGAVGWKRWEKNASGRVAVFSYVNSTTPTVTLAGCCFPDGGKNARTEIHAGSHGEISIDPASGAILRVQMEYDLRGFVPARVSGMVVEYGPVTIDGKSYIVPQYSVSIIRLRSVATLLQWNVGFPTWGPYETQMNVFHFDQYHRFTSKSRVLPGFDPVP
jgi:VWFA-related protein